MPPRLPEALIIKDPKHREALERLIANQPPVTEGHGGKRTWAFLTEGGREICELCHAPLSIVARAEKISCKGTFLPRLYATCACSEGIVRTFVPVPKRKQH